MAAAAAQRRPRPPYSRSQLGTRYPPAAMAAQTSSGSTERRAATEAVKVVPIDCGDPSFWQLRAEITLRCRDDSVDAPPVVQARRRSLPFGLPLLGEGDRPLDAVGMVTVGQQELPPGL